MGYSKCPLFSSETVLEFSPGGIVFKMNNQAFSIRFEAEIPVVVFQNYCTNETLSKLGKSLCDLCDEDRTEMIFDFSQCQLINSLGLATLLEVLMLVRDYEGRVMITGLDATKQKFFNLTGVFALAEHSESFAEALSSLKA